MLIEERPLVDTVKESHLQAMERSLKKPLHGTALILTILSPGLEGNKISVASSTRSVVLCYSSPTKRIQGPNR